MLTTGGDAVNSTLPPAGGVMWRIAEIAKRDGVSDAAVSKMVRRLVDRHELLVERDGRGRVASVNVAQYDELKARHGDPSKQQTTKPLGEHLSDGPNYDKALAEKTAYDAERSRIRLAVDIGELVKRDEVEQAMDDAGLRIGRALEQLGSQVDELAAAYESGGLQKLRIKLRDLAHRTREQIADILEAAAQPGDQAGT
jgi:hypothetical protein